MRMIFVSEQKKVYHIKDYAEKINSTRTRKRDFDRKQFIKKRNQSLKSII